ncbi:hypothetical protein P6U16_07155 [Rhizobium sp. 32-5/1]|uniref:hypothetical protein n=1 Tax=Rhizobium sp. 32-5/1 TaxID=3019602 RepID=UPI00240D16E4|nr:hypothetical protein [Rhizobium sp. 32-5/1]WEZ84402.1 hypothetical protein P6U16_07155 [Rhizobium sp. 32-5/1]
MSVIGRFDPERLADVDFAGVFAARLYGRSKAGKIILQAHRYSRRFLLSGICDRVLESGVIHARTKRGECSRFASGLR